MSIYFYTDGKNKFGPFSKEELRDQKISRNTKIWFYGITNWTVLSEIPQLNDLTNFLPPDLKVKNNIEKHNDDIPIILSVNKKTSPNTISNLSKWLIGSIVLILLSLIIYNTIRNQSDVKLYNQIVKTSYDSNENFEMYVDKFYRDINFYGIYPQKPKKIIIKFSKLDQLENATHIHGVSYGFRDDEKIEIYINPSSWKNFNKPMRYFLMYHELAHDVLNLNDLNKLDSNEGKLMYPEISSYENKNMDDFIENSHDLFEQQSKN